MTSAVQLKYGNLNKRDFRFVIRSVIMFVITTKPHGDLLHHISQPRDSCSSAIEAYSQFHIALPRHVAKFVAKLDTRLRSSKLRGEFDNQIENFEMNFLTSTRSNFATSPNLPCKVRDIVNRWFEDSTPFKNSVVVKIHQERQMKILSKGLFTRQRAVETLR